METKNHDLKTQPICLEFCLNLEQMIFKLTQENFELTVDQTMKFYDLNFPYTYDLLLSNLIYSAIYSQKCLNDIYFRYLENIQMKEKEINKSDLKIIEIFSNYLSKRNTQESYYILENMIERNLIDKDIVCDIIKNTKTLFFSHHNSRPQCNNFCLGTKEYNFLGKIKILSMNDWELHKKYIQEGANPDEIAKIIRNDEVEKLQEISSQTNFDFDQKIEPSLYEKYSFVNYYNVSLIDYAAFFSSVKCFKYLLMNGANVQNAFLMNNTLKYAIAGGNEEIIHLCEQNNSTFEGAYEAAIEFHRNDLFHYIYENKLEKLDDGKTNINGLGCRCIENGNYEIFIYLEKEGMKIDDEIIIQAAKIGNLYLIKSFLQNTQVPNNIFAYAVESENIELIHYLLEQEGIDINAKDKIRGDTALIYASENVNAEIVKLLLEQKGIDINAKNYYGETAFMKASENGNIEIVKLLLEQEGIDINEKDELGRTALMKASEKGNLEIVKLLLEQKGIEINAIDKDGWTALVHGTLNGHTEIVKLLLEQEGIELNAKNDWGYTALIIAAERGNVEIVKLLLEQKGIDINAKNIDEQTALGKASERYIITTAEQKRSDINAQNNEKTGLISDSSRNYIEIVKLLLEQEGIDINNNDELEQKAIKLLSDHGHMSLVQEPQDKTT